MEQFAFAYWWLIFPIMWFIFGIFGMWMAHRRHRDTIELMKTYAAQGKDPAELAKAMNTPDAWGGPWGYGGFLGNRWRRGPYWEWRRFVVFACMAVGFWLASLYAGSAGAERAFTLVAIIMGVLAAGSGLFAVMASMLGRKPPNE